MSMFYPPPVYDIFFLYFFRFFSNIMKCFIA